MKSREGKGQSNSFHLLFNQQYITQKSTSDIFSVFLTRLFYKSLTLRWRKKAFRFSFQSELSFGLEFTVRRRISLNPLADSHN